MYIMNIMLLDENFIQIGFSKRMVYFINKEGTVISKSKKTDEIRILKPGINTFGYRYIFLNGKVKLIHRILAELFIPNDDPEKKYVDHIDSNRLNNQLTNLRWVTMKENNTTDHARKARSINHRCCRYKNIIFKVSKDDIAGNKITHFFENFKTLSNFLQKSHPFIYNKINYGNSIIDGWKIEKISIYSEEAKMFKAKIDQRKENDHLTKLAKKEADRLQKKMQRELKRKEIAHTKELLKEEKRKNRSICQLNDDKQIVKIWPSFSEIERSIGVNSAKIKYACKTHQKLYNSFWCMLKDF